MGHVVIVGAGATGTRTARVLVAQGHDVTIVSRSGGDSVEPGVSKVACDASDPGALAQVAKDAQSLINCANPKYHRWIEDWPPIANSLLRVAQETGATLVTLSNLYGYGKVSAPMTPETPLSADYAKAQVRIAMWQDAKKLHDAGEIRAVEVRASDFIGANCQSQFGDMLIPRLLKGKPVYVLGQPDVAHSWSYVGDVARTLARVAEDASTWGRVWHVPTNPAISAATVVDGLADCAGTARVAVRPIPGIMMFAAGLVNPEAREFKYTKYQFEAPFVIDDSDTRRVLGLEPTPWSDVLADTLKPYL